MSVEIKGIDKLLKQFEALGNKVENAVNTATQGAAEAIARDARQLAPVSTGKLRDSIQVIKSNGAYSIGSDVEYAAAKELGTRLILAKPFLFPAYLLNRDKYLDNIKVAINNIK